MTTTIKITGKAAIEMAEREGLTLSKYADPTEEARDGLTAAEARDVAAEDPELIYLEVSADLVHTRLTEAEVIGVVTESCERSLSGDEARIEAAGP